MFVPLGVFVVRQNQFDVGDARVEIDATNHAVFVTTDVEDEHDQVFFGSCGIHAVEMRFEFCEVLWFDTAQVVVPVSQGFFGFWVTFHEST